MPFHDNAAGPLSRAAYLIAGYIRRTLTQAEHDELDEWVNASDDNMKLFEELTDEKNIEENLAWLDKINVEKALAKTKEKIHFKKNEKPFIRWWAWAAASITLIAGALLVYKLTLPAKNKPTEIVQQDVQPGGNKATLTLSNGSVLDLTNAKNGLLKNDHGIAVNKNNDSELLYTGRNFSPELYNTLATPKGGQYKVTLSDGTKVWLNSESSLKYPVSFDTKQRTVELNGEGYFEVAKDSGRPFKVVLSDQCEVKVFGTHFNIMSYPDESAKWITLLEGSVELSSETSTQKLIPGQQGQINASGIKLINNVDTEEITGWKNGLFIFHDEQISSIMKQVARWYDVEISYKINTSDHFNATISRNEPLSRLLHFLEETGKIHFKIDKKRIDVLP